jgi:hypothetical protein
MLPAESRRPQKLFDLLNGREVFRSCRSRADPGRSSEIDFSIALTAVRLPNMAFEDAA